MKKFVTLICATMSVLSIASAQNPRLNPLNYSGKMYLSSIQAQSTPRYVSYENHAIISSELTVPAIKVTPVLFDFEKNTITLNDEEIKLSKVYVKGYTSEYPDTYVIYMDLEDNPDKKMELVWPETGSPYLLTITQKDDRFLLEKMNLSHTPVAVSAEEALMRMMNSAGSEMLQH